jgi:hypothetical protein
LQLKIEDFDFRQDILPILIPSYDYDIDRAYKTLLREIITVM